MAEPKCPECQGSKFDYQAIHTGPGWIWIVYCGNCGHIIGVAGGAK